MASKHNHGHSHDHSDDEHGHGHEHEHEHEHEHGHSHNDDGFSCSKNIRLISMLSIIFCFFIVEIVVGHITHALTLIADSFHMLSDSIALCIALLSIWVSKRETAINTFGWVRAEILGALINSVFLVALCVTIIIEAIEKFIPGDKHKHEDAIHDVNLLLIVATIGLAINIVGLFIFGHGHSHSVESRKKEEEVDSIENDENFELHLVTVNSGDAKATTNAEDDIEASKSLVDQNKIVDKKTKTKKSFICCAMLRTKHVDLNIRAVFLHVLADALGSVVVIISGVLNKYHEKIGIQKEYIKYVDPSLSLVLVLLILFSTVPLLKEAAFILLQTVPKTVELDKLKKELKNITGVVEIQNLHVWKLSDRKNVASAHITFNNIEEYLKVSTKIKRVFHMNALYATTIEPHFLENKTDNTVALAINNDNNNNNNNAIC